MTNWSADPCLPHDARSHKSSGIQKKPAGQGSNPCAPTLFLNPKATENDS